MWHEGAFQYRQRGLDLRALDGDPLHQLKGWMEEAQMEEPEANAMALSTSALSHQPSCRMVLVKKIDDQGLYFFSHYESRKGKEIAANAKVCGLFYWPRLERQVVVEGACQPISEEESDQYFASRPLQSQVATSISCQGQVIESRQQLLDRYQQGLEKAASGIKRPPWWGGYCLKPHRFEFWQGREYRLHDRFQYLLQEEKWKIQRLSP